MIMNANEARQLVKNNRLKQLKAVEDAIEVALKGDKYYCYFHEPLTEEVKEELIAHAYKLSEENQNQKDGYIIKISWE